MAITWLMMRNTKYTAVMRYSKFKFDYADFLSYIMRLLELLSGTKSVGKVAEQLVMK